MAQEEDVPREPQHRRDSQAPVGHRHQYQRTQPIDRDVPDGANARHHGLAQGIAGLHDAVGNPSREIVLEERPALPHDVPVTLPPDEAGHPRYHGVVAHQTVSEQGEWPTEQNNGRHAHQHRRGGAESGDAVAGLHQRHQLADEHGDQRVDQSHRKARDEHRGIQSARLADEMPIEREEPARRCGRRQFGRSYAGFEERKHGCRQCAAACVRVAPTRSREMPDCTEPAKRPMSVVRRRP